MTGHAVTHQPNEEETRRLRWLWWRWWRGSVAEEEECVAFGRPKHSDGGGGGGGGGGGRHPHLCPAPSSLQTLLSTTMTTMMMMMMMMMNTTTATAAALGKVPVVVVVVVAALVSVQPCAAAADKLKYFMDDPSTCTLIGYNDIPSGVTYRVLLKQPGSPVSSVTNCLLRFRAESTRELLQVKYKEFYIKDCTITFAVNQKKYGCNAAKPYDAQLSMREVDIKLERPVDRTDYGGELSLSTYENLDPGPRADAASNPSLIGIIVGTVCGIVLLILLLAVVGICCYQRSARAYRRGGADGAGAGRRGQLTGGRFDSGTELGEDYDPEECSDIGGGGGGKCYINNLEKNGGPPSPAVVTAGGGGGGTEKGPPPGGPRGAAMRYTDMVRQYSDSYYDDEGAGERRKEEEKLGGDGDPGGKTLPSVEVLATSPKRFGEGKPPNGGGPRSPVVDALQSNEKFRASYQSTEDDAEERARRLDGGGGGDTPPTPPPPLPVVSTQAKARPCRQQRRRAEDGVGGGAGAAAATIRRVPARSSATSDDLDLLEKELLGDNDGGDPGIQILRPDVVGANNNSSSAAAVVPIKIQPNSNPNPNKLSGQTVEAEDLDVPDFPTATATTDEPQPFTRGGPAGSGSSSTQHSLRPNRHRSPAAKSKQHHHHHHNNKEPPGGGSGGGLNSLRKRGPKSPRLNTKGRRLVSEAEDESVYNDDSLPRSETPLSLMGSRMPRTDDLESLPPLRRSASRQSLFASRTSLYSRRGKKERRPSVADSLDSYAQDDLNLYTAGSLSQPVSEQHARAFKSLGSITAGNAAAEAAPPPRKCTASTSTNTAGGVGTSQISSSSSSSSHHHHHHHHQRKPHMPRKSTASHKSSMSTQTIEQKGTQTEAGPAPTQQPRPIPLAKPLLKPTVKPLLSRDPAGSGNLPQGQPVSHKSHFQPIAASTGTTASATGNAPTSRFGQDPGLPPPPPPPQQQQQQRADDPSRPTKSPWELLCELTGAADDPTRRRGGQSPAGAYSEGGASSSPSAAGRAGGLGGGVPMPGPAPSPSPSAASRVPPPRYTPSPAVGSEASTALPPPTGGLYPRKSSWNALKELTDNQLTYTPQQNTESIV